MFRLAGLVILFLSMSSPPALAQQIEKGAVPAPAATVEDPAASEATAGTELIPRKSNSAQPNVSERPSVTDELSVSSEFLISAINATVAREVEERLQARQDFYWAIALAVGTVLIGFFGFLGIGQLQGMRRQIREGLFAELQTSIVNNEGFRSTIEKRVSDKVQAETSAQLVQVSQQVALNRLASLAAKVEAGTGFSDFEKNALMEGLFVLKDSPTIISSNEFKESLQNVLKAFNNADLDAEIDQIHEALGGSLLEEEFSISLPLMLNYAERVLGVGNPSQTERERFLHYTTVCKRKKRYEDALPYMLIASTLPRLGGLLLPNVDELKQDFQHLDDEEKKKCARIIAGWANAEGPAPTSRSLRIRESFRSFLAAHRADFSPWMPASDKE